MFYGHHYIYFFGKKNKYKLIEHLKQTIMVNILFIDCFCVFWLLLDKYLIAKLSFKMFGFFRCWLRMMMMIWLITCLVFLKNIFFPLIIIIQRVEKIILKINEKRKCLGYCKSFFLPKMGKKNDKMTIRIKWW